MLVLLMGIAIGFNAVILIWKIKKQRYFDMILDLTILGIISFLTAGTVTGFCAGMVGSALTSMYLLFKPVYLFKN